MNVAKKEEFVAQNLDRLVEQCAYGDESLSFLAVYSFIEGYLRERCGIPFEARNSKGQPFNLHNIMGFFANVLNQRHDVTTGEIVAENQNRKDIKKY